MSYYPLSQIKTNLFTISNQEFIIKSTGDFYSGKYWSTSDGKFFTGEGPQDATSLELIKSKEQNDALEPNIYSNEVQIVYYNDFHNDLPPKDNIVPNYLQLKNIDFNNLPKQKYPTIYNPQPTPDDYKLGEFTRYFCKKTNEFFYIEINKDTYNSLNQKDSSYVWELFIPIKYQWIISGEEKEVFKINKNVTKYMMDTFKLPFLNKFLKENYLRFWKPK
jgi:hypothetical protein